MLADIKRKDYRLDEDSNPGLDLCVLVLFPTESPWRIAGPRKNISSHFISILPGRHKYHLSYSDENQEMPAGMTSIQERALMPVWIYRGSSNRKLVGLGVKCSLRDPRFAGSNPAEVYGFFQDVKILNTSPPGGTSSWRSQVWDFRLVKEPQAWKNRPLSKI